MDSPKIFISYRRGLDEQAAGRVADSLRDEFGSESVFLDVEKASEMAGLDFHIVLERWVAECTHFVAIVGHGWIDALPRLHTDGDWVRTETANALSRDDIRVIPLLVSGVEIPDASALPEDLFTLSRRSGINLSNVNYNADIEKLIDAVKNTTVADVVEPNSAIRHTNRDFWAWFGRRLVRAVISAVFLATAIVGIAYYNNAEFRHDFTCFFSEEPVLQAC